MCLIIIILNVLDFNVLDKDNRFMHLNLSCELIKKFLRHQAYIR